MSLQLAIDTAFDGPDAQNLDILGHRFDVMKMTILQFGATTVANGQLLHRCEPAPHEPVHYFLKIFENRLVQSSRRVEYSEWPAMLANVAPPWVGAVDHFLALVAQRLIADNRIVPPDRAQRCAALRSSDPTPNDTTGSKGDSSDQTGRPP